MLPAGYYRMLRGSSWKQWENLRLRWLLNAVYLWRLINRFKTIGLEQLWWWVSETVEDCWKLLEAIGDLWMMFEKVENWWMMIKGPRSSLDSRNSVDSKLSDDLVIEWFAVGLIIQSIAFFFLRKFRKNLTFTKTHSIAIKLSSRSGSGGSDRHGPASASEELVEFGFCAPLWNWKEGGTFD